MSHLTRIALAIILCLAVSTAQAAEIEIVEGHTWAHVSEGWGHPLMESFPTGTGVFGNGGTEGWSGAWQTTTITDSGIAVRHSLQRGPEVSNTNITVTQAVQISFKVDVPVKYQITGAMVVDNDSMPPDNTHYLVALQKDVTVPPYLLLYIAESHDTQDESFIVGDSGGDWKGVFVGGLTGWLAADVEYTFRADTRLMYSYPTGNGLGSTSRGNTELEFLFDANCAADVNADTSIEVDDLGIVLANLGVPPGCSSNPGTDLCRSDINGDGAVEVDDIGLVLSNLGAPCG